MVCKEIGGLSDRADSGRRHQSDAVRLGYFPRLPAKEHRSRFGIRKKRSLADIDKRLEKLQAELLKLACSRTDYKDVAEEIYHLREKKQKLQLESTGRDELKKRIADMCTFLREQLTALTEYDEPLVRRLIEKVTVYEDKFTVEFKSGVTVDVNE